MLSMLGDVGLGWASVMVGWGGSGLLSEELPSLGVSSLSAAVVSVLDFSLAAFCSFVKTLILILFIPLVIWSRSFVIVASVDEVPAIGTVVRPLEGSEPFPPAALGKGGVFMVEDPFSSFAATGFVLRGTRGALPLSILGGTAGRFFLAFPVPEDWVRTLIEELGRAPRELPGRPVALVVT